MSRNVDDVLWDYHAGNGIHHDEWPLLTAEILALRAERDALRAAHTAVLIGGNHLVTVIGSDHPPYAASHDAAMEHYRGVIFHQDRYDAWCCWKAIMLARDAVIARAREAGE